MLLAWRVTPKSLKRIGADPDLASLVDHMQALSDEFSVRAYCGQSLRVAVNVDPFDLDGTILHAPPLSFDSGVAHGARAVVVDRDLRHATVLSPRTSGEA